MKNFLVGVGNFYPNYEKIKKNNYRFFKSFLPIFFLNKFDPLLYTKKFNSIKFIFFGLLFSLQKISHIIYKNNPHSFTQNSELFTLIKYKFIKKYNNISKISMKSTRSKLKSKYYYIFRRFYYVWEKYYASADKLLLLDSEENYEEQNKFIASQLFSLNRFNVFRKICKIRDNLRRQAFRFDKRSRRRYKYRIWCEVKFTYIIHILTILFGYVESFLLYSLPPVCILLESFETQKYINIFKTSNFFLKPVQNFHMVSFGSSQQSKFFSKYRYKRYFWLLEAPFSRKRKFYYAFYLHKTFKLVYNDWWEVYFYKLTLNKFKKLGSTYQIDTEIYENGMNWPRIYRLYLWICKSLRGTSVRDWIPPLDDRSIFMVFDYIHVCGSLFHKALPDLYGICGGYLHTSYEPKIKLITIYAKFWSDVSSQFIVDIDKANCAVSEEVLFLNFFYFWRETVWGWNTSELLEIGWSKTFWCIAVLENPREEIFEEDVYPVVNYAEILRLAQKPHNVEYLEQRLFPDLDQKFIKKKNKLLFKKFTRTRGVGFAKKKHRKLKYKLTHLIPSKKKYRFFKKLLRFFFSKPFSNLSYTYSHFFSKFEKTFLQNDRIFQSYLIGEDLAEFTTLNTSDHDNLNLLSNFTFLDFSKRHVGKFLKSNYNPIFFLSLGVKQKFFQKKYLEESMPSARYLQFYVNGFITHWVSCKSFFIMQSNLTLADKDFTYKLLTSTIEGIFYFSKINVKFFKKFPVSRFVEFFTLSLLKKDLNFFVKFFKSFLEEIFLKEHKRIFYSFEFMLKKFLYKIMAWTKTKGIKFEVSGKISVTGNSKKRRRIVKLGCYSLTHKKLKIDYLLDTIRTSTGVLGFRTFITY